MNANDVIEMYVDDTVRLLPRRQRDDVATELRALLTEELAARAREAGRPADEALAVALVRGYGPPSEVAARYHPAWTLIDPADSQNFLRAGVIGTVVLIVLSALRKLRPADAAADQDAVTRAILEWLGVLVLGFGFKSWARRTWPARAQWKPQDRNRVNRVGVAIVVPVATLIVIFYSAPGWFLELASGGRFDATRLAYTPEFQWYRLPQFIGGLAGSLVLLSFAAIRGRWTRFTRRVAIAINLALALLCLSLAVDGNVFQSAAADELLRGVMGLVALVYLPGVGLQIYNEMGRIDRVAAPKSPNQSPERPAASIV